MLMPAFISQETSIRWGEHFLFREMGLLMTLMISHGTLLLKSTEDYSGYKGFRRKYPSE